MVHCVRDNSNRLIQQVVRPADLACLPTWSLAAASKDVVNVALYSINVHICTERPLKLQDYHIFEFTVKMYIHS